VFAAIFSAKRFDSAAEPDYSNNRHSIFQTPEKRIMTELVTDCCSPSGLTAPPPPFELPMLSCAESGSLCDWSWRIFAAPEIPEGLFDHGETVGDTLALPDGRKIAAMPFQFPQSGMFDLYRVLSPRPATLARTVFVADFTMKRPGILTIALGVDWMVLARCNGKVFCDTRKIGNGEAPVGFDHVAPIACRAGANQLVLEIQGGGLPEAMIAAKLLDAVPLALRFAPWASYPDAEANAMSVIFSGTRVSPAGLDYRKKGTENWTRCYDNLGGQIRRDRDVHVIRLEDLEPDTVYEYRVFLLDDYRGFAEVPAPGVHCFRSAPRAGKAFSFLATADVQVPTPERTKFLNALLSADDARRADFFAFLGDVVWTSNCDKAVIEDFVMVCRNAVANRIPLVTVRGNHEIYGKDTNRFFDYFTAPEPGREGYCLFRYGDVCFIVLDFCDDAPRQPFPSTRCLHDFEPYIAREARWLRRAVRLPMCREAKYRVVLAHGVPVGDSCEYMPRHVRQVIDPVFAGDDPEVKIHLWLGGHVHRPFRSVPGENVCYSAVAPDDFRPGSKHPRLGGRYRFPVLITGGPRASLPDELQLTSFKVEVAPDAITVSARDRYGREFDRIAVAPDGSVTELFRAEFLRRYEY